MDPNYRLLKLVSLVAFSAYEHNQCGLRHQERSVDLLPDELGVMAHQMCMYYAGAVQYHLTKDRVHHRDFEEFPDFTLPFVTNLNDKAEHLLGEILIRTLGLLSETSHRTLGRRWADDVISTCWEIKLAAHPDRFGPDA